MCVSWTTVSLMYMKKIKSASLNTVAFLSDVDMDAFLILQGGVEMCSMFYIISKLISVTKLKNSKTDIK